LEEFKNSFPNEETYLNEHKVESLQQAAILADDCSHTKESFSKSIPEPVEQTGRRPTFHKSGNPLSAGNNYNFQGSGKNRMNPHQTNPEEQQGHLLYPHVIIVNVK